MSIRQAKETIRWRGNTRSDGLRVERGTWGFVILPLDLAATYERCPCCDRQFEEARDARVAADFLIPSRRDE